MLHGLLIQFQVNHLQPLNHSSDKYEYEKICDEILECGKKIRYVGIYDYGKLYDKMRSGLKSYLSREETELSLSHVVYRGSTRKKHQSELENLFLH